VKNVRAEASIFFYYHNTTYHIMFSFQLINVNEDDEEVPVVDVCNNVLNAL